MPDYPWSPSSLLLAAVVVLIAGLFLIVQTASATTLQRVLEWGWTELAANTAHSCPRDSGVCVLAFDLAKTSEVSLEVFSPTRGERIYFSSAFRTEGKGKSIEWPKIDTTTSRRVAPGKYPFRAMIRPYGSDDPPEVLPKKSGIFRVVQ